MLQSMRPRRVGHDLATKQQLKDLVGLQRTVQIQLLGISGWGIDLNYCDTEWFALEMNQDHSVIFEIASKYCILDSSIDY